MNASFEAYTAQRPPGEARFRLIETMRWADGAVQHVDRHAARLARSARHFSFPFSEKAFRAVLQQATASLPSGTHRLRLTLGAGGGIQSEAAPLEGEQQEPLRLALAEERAHSEDPFFRHKTTWRRVYEHAHRAARERGFDEALLLNERGEITEGTRTNLFLEKGGALYTPPVRCGLLPGVGRAAWLAEERAGERVLNLDDLREADALYLISALRGRRRAVWGE